ncbi:hypothetical protein SMALB_2108 [Streptomyces malaysiensis]|uniref:ABC transporter domain-containing protein n=1 Tax=Streptomyces malaysiensis TaxID=92644 RepID=A0A7X5X016_STRMQ|nr:hypothetical protein [Streptomyces malaysiensis]
MTAFPSSAPTTARPAVAAARATDLTKVYGQGETQVVALDSVSVGFRQTEFTAIMGPSGSGKSTLMHCMAGPGSGIALTATPERRHAPVPDFPLTAATAKAPPGSCPRPTPSRAVRTVLVTATDVRNLVDTPSGRPDGHRPSPASIKVREGGL